MRESRQKINNPRRTKEIADYDATAAEWDSNLAKLISHRNSDTLLALEDLPEAYRNIPPNDALPFAQLQIDESFEPDGFKEEMKKNTYRQTRETETTKAPSTNVIK